MEGRLDLLMHQAFEHHAHHAEVDPRLARGRQKRVVFTHPSVAADPRERSFDDPAAREEVKAWESRRWFLALPHPAPAPAWTLDDLEAPAEGLPQPGLQRP